MNCMVFILLLPDQGITFVYLLGGFPLVVHKYSSLLYHTRALPRLFQSPLPQIAEATPQAEGRQTTFAGIMDMLISLGRKGVILETIVARSSTADGIRLMRGIGFTEIPSITRRRNFIIEVEKSGLKEIIQYKQALQESEVPEEIKSRYCLVPDIMDIDIKRLSSYTHEYDNCFTLSYNKGIIAIEENVNSFI